MTLCVLYLLSTYTGRQNMFRVVSCALIFTAIATPSRISAFAKPAPVARLGSVDLGILAETTPVVWKGEPLLMECIQGGRYYNDINFTSYPNEPQPSGYLRFTNPLTGEHSHPFAYGYGLGNAVVVDGRMFVFATKTPFGINSNNSLVSAFWSDDLITWSQSTALRVGQANMFPPKVTSKRLFNTCVREVPENASADESYTFVMAYEFNEPGAGWQTGFAVTRDKDLRFAKWECVSRPTSAKLYATLSHANPTLRFSKDDGYWYLLSTRGTNGILVEEIWRTRDVASFDWEAPPNWSRGDASKAAFLAPSHADQVPVSNATHHWHPDTRPVVAGNASAVSEAKNDNVSDLDLCTFRLPDGRVATVMYYAWGDQELGPTAMVLAMGLVVDMTQEQVLASHFEG